VYVNTWARVPQMICKYCRAEPGRRGAGTTTPTAVMWTSCPRVVSSLRCKTHAAPGKPTSSSASGDGVKEGAAGGTGIAIYKNALYAEINDRIVRYPLTAGTIVPTVKPEVVVLGLPLTGDHPMHPFVIDAKGNLFVDVGTATNACDVQNRMPGTKGHEPCTELETRGGIWRFDANKTGQKFSRAERYATGIRNGEGMDFDSAGRLFVTQHGRDQLLENYPKLFSAKNGHELPAEEVFIVEQGGDFGWPTC
jgi:glucose/arabinose dehydrogenase